MIRRQCSRRALRAAPWYRRSGAQAGGCAIIRVDDVLPFDFRVVGPVSASRPPKLPLEPGVWDRLRHAWSLHEHLSTIDESVGLAGPYDARIYVYAKRPLGDDEPKYVEGLAEQGGEEATVQVDLDEATVDLALIAAMHELFHLVGAEDQYGPGGRVRVPQGLAAPDREPLFPQEQAALMARTIPKSENEGELADELEEVVVGRYTARTVGWVE